MPYGPGKKDPPAWVMQMGDAAMKQWMAVWNEVYAKTNDEGKAFAAAGAAMNRRGKADGGGEVEKADDAALSLFIPITKIDEEKRLLYGRITEELVDKSGEAFDYESSKPYYEKWSSEISKATDGKSVGNLRAMHANKVAGKLTELSFDDAGKAIDCVAKVLDDSEWRMCLEGAYTGFSQGGRYVKRWKDESGTQKYTVNPVEVSLVDSPCLSTARFELLKADGTVEEKQFKAVEDKAEKTEEAAPNTAEPDPNKVKVAEKAADDPPAKLLGDMSEDEYLMRSDALGLNQSREAIGKRWVGYPNTN